MRDDLDQIERGQRLHGVRRFFHQRFFEQETRDAEYASRVEPNPRLETVSEHSWHVADSVLIVGPRFPNVELGRAVQLAVLHDKLELFIGDIDPIGRDGTGRKAHAFDAAARERKRAREEEASAFYLESLSPQARSVQAPLLCEALACQTPEAQFVKSLDKLVALVFILRKKAGNYQDRHLRLLYDLTSRNSELFAPLSAYHWELFERIVASAAGFRSVTAFEIHELAKSSQLRLF